MSMLPISEATAHTKKDWLNPLNKLIIQKAVKQRAAQVTLGDGRIIAFDYEKWEGRVLIKPVATPAFPSEFVPRGYFLIDRLVSSDWLEV